MTAISATSMQMTFHGIAAAISSPVLPDGTTLSSSPDGLQLDLFGPAPVPASPSVMPADKAAVLTHGICGLNGFGSSASVALTQSLANRLRERLASDGSIEFSQTWKLKVTPAGRRYWAHTASAPPTSASASSGWPTPSANEFDAKPETTDARRARYAMKYGNNGFGLTVAQAAQLAPWPSPQSRDGAHSRSGMLERTGGRRRNLDDYVELAGWRSPNVTDHKGVSGPNCSAFQNGNINRLADQVGTMLNGSPASTARRGALNPAFTRWLLGFPATWDACAPAATPSSRKLPRSS
jgi:hypothetical protein